MDIAALILSALAIVATGFLHRLSLREIEARHDSFARACNQIDDKRRSDIKLLQDQISDAPNVVRAFEDLVARAQGVLDDADARLARVDDQPKLAEGGAARPAAIPFWQPKATAGTVTQTIQGTPLSGPGAQSDA